VVHRINMQLCRDNSCQCGWYAALTCGSVETTAVSAVGTQVIKCGGVETTAVSEVGMQN
jgi:hypothetical protein